jgi:hypothetical protein
MSTQFRQQKLTMKPKRSRGMKMGKVEITAAEWKSSSTKPW